jgi:hypothetical protein
MSKFEVWYFPKGITHLSEEEKLKPKFCSDTLQEAMTEGRELMKQSEYELYESFAIIEVTDNGNKPAYFQYDKDSDGFYDVNSKPSLINYIKYHVRFLRKSLFYIFYPLLIVFVGGFMMYEITRMSKEKREQLSDNIETFLTSLESYLKKHEWYIFAFCALIYFIIGFKIYTYIHS